MLSLKASSEILFTTIPLISFGTVTFLTPEATPVIVTPVPAECYDLNPYKKEMWLLNEDGTSKKEPSIIRIMFTKTDMHPKS